jgi:hypothetical protein
MFFPGTDWAKASPEAELVDSAKLAAAVEYLKAHSPFGGSYVRELTVIRNGRMIWEGPDIDDTHIVFSITKSITSTVLGLLIDDGKAMLDTLAMEHLPALAADYPNVTLRHLATMTSGYRSVGEFGAWHLSHTPFTPDTPYFTPPGSQSFYYNSATDLLSGVLTQIAQEPIVDLFRRRIADPIGMNPDKWRWPDWGSTSPPGGPVVNIGGDRFHTSAREAARFGHLFLNHGQWDGEQLISAEWVDEATSVQVPASVPMHPENVASNGSGEYGYNWWVNGIGPDGSRLLPGATSDTYYAWGYQNNHIFVIPEWDMVVVRQALDEPWQLDPITPSIPPSTWGTFLSQIGSALLPPSGPITMSLPPGQSYAVADNDSDLTFDDLGDKTNDRLAAATGFVGEADSEDRNSVTRLVVKFGLANLPDAVGRLESATLRFFLEDIGGVPTGPVSVWHSIDDNDVEQLASDYEDLSYEDTLLDLVKPSDEGQAYYEVDVTEFVVADYAADEKIPQSAFRIQVDTIVFVDDGQEGRYRFAMPGAEANHPELVLTFIPEPSTLVLATFGLLGLLIHARQRNAA